MFGYSWGWVKTETECGFNCIQPGQKVKIKFENNTIEWTPELSTLK